MKKVKTTSKVLLSLWICYHLLVMVVMPNGGSFIGRYYQDYLVNYANALGLNTPWSFFSPDPASVIYLEYSVLFEDQDGYETKPAIDAYYPSTKDEYLKDLRVRRDYCVARFCFVDTQRLKQWFGPYICRMYPEASRVLVRNVMATVPPFDTSVKIKSQAHETSTIPMVQEEVNCKVDHEGQDEVIQ